ncbi:MAG TPA: hypothetical protein VGW14_03950 [Thermoleophilaceae bacterium]|nr:hypothetical protein [Thermoleophilaceae bacterium]
MKIKGYTVLGWLTWQGIKTVAKRKLGQDKVKLGAAATVLLVLVAGLAAAKAATGED